MRNITVSVTDHTYHQARVWAAENNTSISAAVEYMLENMSSILRVRKPPRQPRRNNRFAVPSKFAAQLDSEDVIKLLSQQDSMFSVRESRRNTEFSQL